MFLAMVGPPFRMHVHKEVSIITYLKIITWLHILETHLCQQLLQHSHGNKQVANLTIRTCFVTKYSKILKLSV